MQNWDYIEYTKPEPPSATGNETKVTRSSDYIVRHDCVVVEPRKRMSCGVTIFVVAMSAAVMIVSFLL